MNKALLLCALVACGGGEDSVFGPPTASTCPPNSTLTYENFGHNFMTVYCTRCHSSELIGADRHGAPPGHDFDSIFGIRPVTEHIDETTASGPAATNMGMPPEMPFPTMMEREQLGAWIACGTP